MADGPITNLAIQLSRQEASRADRVFSSAGSTVPQGVSFVLDDLLLDELVRDQLGRLVLRQY